MKEKTEPATSCARRLAALTALIALALGACSQPEEEPSPPPTTDAVKAPTQSTPEELGMVLVRASDFVMGKDGDADHSPAHTVHIHEFYLDAREVTNAQYQEYCETTGKKLPEFWGMEEFHSGPDFPDYPVVGVSWLEARAYAQWRGARLPTEAEWEYAARGGLVGKNYSHGDTLDPAVYQQGEMMPVASFPPNGFGLHDMTRNVVEWVNDWYDADYYDSSPAENPPGPEGGKFRVIRGGGWHTGPYCSRLYIRTALQSNWVDFNVGFRCARHKEGSAALRLGEIIESEGIAPALSAYRDWLANAPDDYFFDESEFNELGYRLLGDEKVGEAIEIFRLNVEAHPQSANAFDSLGEAYKIQGNTELAILNYKRSLELNPHNRGAQTALEELQGVENQ
jgi:formylglycine-generating enzyme required for sulfatase activity